jgi:type IV pilus assembly protein PilE
MKRNRGFTLLELMIVVLVIAVLAGIAISSYQNQIRKSRRAEAKQIITDIGLRQEKWRSNHVSYFGTDSDATEIANFGAIPSGTYYTIAVTTAESGTAYTLTGTPKGDQLKDSCGTLTWAYATGTVTKTPAGCW